MAKNLKCTKKRWCIAMEDRLAPFANQRVKGLVQLTVTNIATGKDYKHGALYRRTPSDNGLMLNFCPWCGANLAEIFGFKDKVGD